MSVNQILKRIIQENAQELSEAVDKQLLSGDEDMQSILEGINDEELMYQMFQKLEQMKVSKNPNGYKLDPCTGWYVPNEFKSKSESDKKDDADEEDEEDANLSLNYRLKIINEMPIFPRKTPYKTAYRVFCDENPGYSHSLDWSLLKQDEIATYQDKANKYNVKIDELNVVCK